MNARNVARNLLGKYLIRRVNGPGRASKTRAYKITETEAYVGPHDKASHAHRGMTKRNEVMWGPPGRWYVYFTYGMHYMLNIVTGKDGYPSAVLIRAIRTVESIPQRSSVLQNARTLRMREKLNGPGKLTKALKIDKRLNGKLASRASGLWIEDRGVTVRPRDIKRTPRVGIGYAEEWVGKPLRYILKP
ncbi:MAG: DNA-3-methyladenine glycosylase [Patescibacteria group bacterium]